MSISDNYTLEEFFDYKNFSSGFLREVGECIEVIKMRFLLCVNQEGGMDVIKGEESFVLDYIQNDVYGKHQLTSILDWVKQCQVGEFLEVGNYVIVRVKNENSIL